VIQLVQNGGPSQMDLSDPKPELAKRGGQPHPDGVEIHQPNDHNVLLPSLFEFRRHDECGMEISEVLQAEAIRDSVLAANGKLDTTSGGPAIMLAPRQEGLQTVSEKDPTPNAKNRRSLYLLARRNYPLEFLQVFDFPVIQVNCNRRINSATPLQSLTMLNDEFMVENAR
jgi:Protein of unknown function (DUF1553)/Protein of unknown function (DUF1501)